MSVRWVVTGGGVNPAFVFFDYNRYNIPSSPRQIWVSDDAITWTQVPYPGTNPVLTVEYDGQQRIVVGNNDTLGNCLYTTTDLSSWTAGNVPALPDGNVFDVRYGGGTWVAAGLYFFPPTSNPPRSVAYSTDGLTWTQGGVITTDLYTIDYNPTTNKWLGAAINRLLLSSDGGATWSNPFAFGVNISINRIRYLNGLWFAVGYNSATLTGITYVSSNDGATWTQATGTLPSTSHNGIAYGNGRWVLVGEDANPLNTLCTSTDGYTWSSATSGGFPNAGNNIAFGGGQWVAVGGTGVSQQIVTSVDGSNWSFVAQPTFNNGEYGLGITYIPPPPPAVPSQPIVAQEFQNIHLPSHNAVVPYYRGAVVPGIPNIQPPPPGTFKEPRQAKDVISRCFGSLVPNRNIPDPCQNPRSPHEKRDIQQHCSGVIPVADYNARLNNYQRPFGTYQVGFQQSPKSKVVATWPPLP